MRLWSFPALSSKLLCISTFLPNWKLSKHHVLCLVIQSCPTLLQPCEFSLPGDSPGKNTGVGCHGFLQGIFPTQGGNPGLQCFRRVIYQLSHQGNPKHHSFGFLWKLHKQNWSNHLLSGLIQSLVPLLSPDVKVWDWKFQPSNHMVFSTDNSLHL